MNVSRGLLDITLKSSAYDELDDILFNLELLPHFVWILGTKGAGKTHCLNYIGRKLFEGPDTFPIYVDLESSKVILTDLETHAISYIDQNLQRFGSSRGVKSLSSVTKQLSKSSGRTTFVLCIDGIENNPRGFRDLFRIQNQGYFEELIGCGYYFFIAVRPESPRRLDSYFSGRTVNLKPFESLSEIRTIIKHVDRKNVPKPGTCLKILEETRGNPGGVVSLVDRIARENSEMESINKQFVADHIDQIDDACKRFGIDGFRARLISWLSLFPTIGDKELALKLTNFIHYINGDFVRKRLKQCYREIVSTIDPRDEWSEIIVCSFAEAAKSGEYILYRLRSVANLSEDQCCHWEHLKDKIKSSSGLRAVVFVDDFVGSGSQAIELWKQARNWLADIDAYLLVVCGTEAGIHFVKEITGLRVLVGDIIPEEGSILSPKNTYFNDKEKKRLQDLCRFFDEKEPFGYRDGGLCIAFEHRTPNNTISILRSDDGLFPRRGW